jgi:hypothetical protein
MTNDTRKQKLLSLPDTLPMLLKHITESYVNSMHHCWYDTAQGDIHHYNPPSESVFAREVIID